MADAYGRQDDGFEPDMREWTPDMRRRASIGVFAVAAVLVLVGVIFYFAAPGTASWLLIAAIVVLVLLLLLELAIVATGIATEENSGPQWLRGSAAETQQAGVSSVPPAHEEDAEDLEEIDLRCPQCQELFTVQDTGERPLEIDCPHCGAHGQVDLPAEHDHAHDEDAHDEDAHEDEGAETQMGGGLADEPLPGLEDEEGDAEPDEDLPSISLKCPACGTQFDVEDDGERPLKTTCPGCGKSGKLK